MVYRLWEDADRKTLNSMNFQTFVKGCASIKNRGKHEKRYLEIYMGFDIETTTMPSHNGFMYHWQLSINDIVIFGTRWHEFTQIIEKLKKDLVLRKTTRAIIWVANLGFEFSFMAKHLNITRLFAKEQRQPLVVEVDNCLEFRDCLAVSGGSLASLAKDFCKTQKMTGDLDYDILRNSEDGKNLTEAEEKYCENDVVILSEFSEYIFKTYIYKEKYIPITKTGLLRQAVRKNVTPEIKLHVTDCFPDEELYNIMMQDTFRGGYVHANIMYCDEKIEGIDGFDITSSYPAQMNRRYCPVSPFVKANPDEFWKHYNNKCMIIHVVYYGVTSRFAHSIESKSKCVKLQGEIIDNGRVSRASLLETWHTELDFDVFNMFYNFKDYEIKELYIAERGDYPQYLMKPINEAYTKKAELKRAGLSGTPEYALAKSYINSGYGLTVQRMVRFDITYDNGVWGVDGSKFNFNKEAYKAFLLPQWGLYVAAHARHQLLTTVYEIETEYRNLHPNDRKGCVIYCDTDSIKLVHGDEVEHIIDNYNKRNEKEMAHVCAKRGLDYEIFHDLGCYEKEFENVTGKFLGAKRYIITENGKTGVTVAGLPKRALPEYCEKNGLDIYETFTNFMLIDVDVSMKNAHAYADEPYEEIVNGVRMRELSGCGIFKIPFTMKLDKFFAFQIATLNNKAMIFEKREHKEKSDNSERIIKVARFMVDYNIKSIHKLSKEFNESETTIRKYITEELSYIDSELYQQCVNLMKAR